MLCLSTVAIAADDSAGLDPAKIEQLTGLKGTMDAKEGRLQGQLSAGRHSSHRRGREADAADGVSPVGSRSQTSAAAIM